MFPDAIVEREAYILDAVQTGDYEVAWAEVQSSTATHTAVFTVMSDGLKVQGVRVNVSARLEQQIADALDCLLLTPKLADLVYAQAKVVLPPLPRPITSATSAMVNQSQKIDVLVAKANLQEGDLVSTVGKHWCIVNQLAMHSGRACNYGWHFHGPSFEGMSGEICASQLKDATGQFFRVIQGVGTAHNQFHVDYSQNCVLVKNDCLVDGQRTALEEVLQDYELASLASHQGALSVVRQPNV